MIGKAVFSCRPTRACASVLGVVACAALALALSATPALAAEPCPNEQLRTESNTDPATGQPYSTGLPECRAYEMVSPLYKQAHDAGGFNGFGIPAAPNGETVGFGSEGAFSEPENYRVNFFPSNVYLSRRGASGWITLSGFAPRNLVDAPYLTGLNADFSPDLRSAQVSCGYGSAVHGEQKGLGVVCARRKPDGSWVSTPLHTTVDGSLVEGSGYLGGSSDLSRVFIEPTVHLLPGDTSAGGGIYELAGVAAVLPGEVEELRLVNVDNSGQELLNAGDPPLLGTYRAGPAVEGSAYHAISANGGTVFFTATPTEEQLPGGEEQATVYARVGAKETVAVSNPSPSECTTCSPKAKPATFQGASADGSKVFFTTEQQLLNSDKNLTTDLYEYDFNPPAGHPHLVQVSGGAPEANVRGVVRTSSDGSHVYFVAIGVLTEEAATKGKPNLYGYDTLTEKTKFVATLSAGTDAELWGEKDTKKRDAQTTPDGRYLVFSSAAQLAGDTNIGAVYRYDFETGELTWISHAAPGFATGNKGQPAIITPLNASVTGANATIDDWNRAISENGEDIVFTTSEQLQENDVDGATDVYLWHNGTVSMMSAGGGREPAMSSSGSDIFFTTANRLVGQDTDVLRDVYDARVGGGFPAPPAEPSCPGDGCQGSPSRLPSFSSSASSLVPAGGNLAPASISVSPAMESKPKPLTEAQQLAKALAACKSKPKNRRGACESQARRKYAAQQLAKALRACKSKPRNKRGACESQARKRYGR